MLRTRTQLAVALLLALLTACPLAAQEPPPERTAPAALAWGPDGRLLVAAGGLLARFDLNSDQEELLSDSINAFALSPDGQRLAVADLKQLSLRSYSTFQFQARLSMPAAESEHAGSVLALAWSSDGTTLAGGTHRGHVLLWDAGNNELWADVAVEPESPVATLSFSADGRLLLSAFEDGRAVLWDIEAREVVKTFSAPESAADQPPESVVSIVLSPDGRHLLGTWRRGEQTRMILLDDQGKTLWERAGKGVAFTPDGVAVLALAPPYRIAALYRTADATALRIFEPTEGVQVLQAVCLSPDGKQLAGAGEDALGEVLIVWNFETGRILKTRR
jgi:WD40 repeat protein